ncbi:MAG: site-2 protease family protein [Thaumarchaeota archaeon]|nr:site-2 protease family protein [Nitrososphaerota archaeon]
MKIPLILDEALEAYYDRLEEIKGIVAKHFTVEDVFYEAGLLTFLIGEREIKEAFKRLYRDLREIGYIPSARMEDGRVIIRVFKYREPTLGFLRYRRLPLILFLITFIAILADGYIWSAFRSLYSIVFGPRSLLDNLFESGLYAIVLLSILGLHELAHLLAARRSGMSASMPYFIPGIPGFIPTFGAVIFQKEPIVNRDDMFDLGISGPAMSFILSTIAAFLAIELYAPWLTESELEGIIKAVEARGVEIYNLQPPLMLQLIVALLRLQAPGKVPLMSGAIFFAIWLGYFVTALNLLPIWQLDGSKIFRSVLTARQFRIVSYVALAVLAVTGYFFIAILFYLLMSRMPDIPPLDEVSPLSRGRKLAFFLVLIMIVLSFVIALPF